MHACAAHQVTCVRRGLMHSEKSNAPIIAPHTHHWVATHTSLGRRTVWSQYSFWEKNLRVRRVNCVCPEKRKRHHVFFLFIIIIFLWGECDRHEAAGSGRTWATIQTRVCAMWELALAYNQRTNPCDCPFIIWLPSHFRNVLSDVITAETLM